MGARLRYAGVSSSVGLPDIRPRGRSAGALAGRGRHTTWVLVAILISVQVGVWGALVLLDRLEPSASSSPVASRDAQVPSVPLPSSPEESIAAYLASFPVLSSPGASLDPDAPSLPVPPGSVLLNAQMEGSGPSAYRLVAWWSGAGYEDTVAFYGRLSDPRWHGSGSSTTPQAAVFMFSDGTGMFSDARVEVDRTDPVRIGVDFRPLEPVSESSVVPGPTVGLGPWPAASALVEGFPVEFIPGGARLVDASSIDRTYFAIFAGPIDVAAYRAQIASVADITATQDSTDYTVVLFTFDGHPGQVALDKTTGELEIEVTS